MECNCHVTLFDQEFVGASGLSFSTLDRMLVCTRRWINAGSRRAFHLALPRRREPFDPATVERISENVDVCIVGAGPAGLSAAIRLKQLEQEKGKEFRVVVLEKGSEVGSSNMCLPVYRLLH